MRIIKNEMKKIFNSINLLLVGLITIIIWILFMSINIEYFVKDNHGTAYNTSVYLLEQYGTTMDENEFKDFKKYREKKAQEAAKYLSTKEVLVKSGIHTYEDFESIYNDEKKYSNRKELEEIYSKIVFEDDVYVFWLIQELDYFIERYENKDNWIGLGYENTAQKERHYEIINKGDGNSPLNFIIIRNYNTLIFGIIILVLISIPILISPIFINDNKNKVNYLQYSSRIGRTIFSKKIIASVLSAIIITSIQLGILFIAYKANNTYMFWDCSISSYISDIASWFDITFGEYIILSVVLTYIVGVVTSVITILVSSNSNNYITAIGTQIPIMFVLGGILKSVGMYDLTTTYYPKYTLHILYGSLIVTSILLITRRIKKEKVLDI